MVKAVYSGTFDPITNGHLDVIERACRLYDEVYVTIFGHPSKAALFTIEERLQLMRKSVKHLDNVHVDASTELAVDYCQRVGAVVLVRGLRSSSDFEYEEGMAHANRFLNADVDTVFLMSRPEHTMISSSRVKEIARYHRDVSALVPECVNEALKKKMEVQPK